MLSIKKIKSKDIDRDYVEIMSCIREVTLPIKILKQILASRSANEQTFIAKNENGKTVGIATIIFEKKMYHEGKCVAHIEDVSVHADHRNSGVGSALIEHCISIARNEQCYKMILDCSKELKKYYKRFGFFKSGVRMRLDI
jgi:glucosamine-phosphate N-acetyltransferase